MQHPLLYEVNTRCWLAALSDRVGRRLTLAEVPDAEFEFWRQCGFTHLWLMGVWSLGPRGRAWSRKCFAERADELRANEIAGSPYAITGYNVSPKLGGDSALAKFRSRLKAHGIKLILDFIPNHTALDHPWVKEHPEFYLTTDGPRAGTVKPYRGATKWFAHGIPGYGTPWADTLQLNYRNPNLRRALIQELLKLAEKCDGIRCDMAMLVLNEVFERTFKDFPGMLSFDKAEFWTEAIAAVRLQRTDFLFLGEVYWNLEARLQELGFDFTYDKVLYDQILLNDAPQLTKYLQSLSPAFLSRCAHFIENHDEPRIASLLSPERHRAAALLVLALPGMRFLHEGQFSSWRIHANVHFGKRTAEESDKSMQRFYERLLHALKSTAVGSGDWKLLKPTLAWSDNPTHENFALIQWQSQRNAFDLAVINLGGTRGQCFAPIDIDGLGEDNWTFRDLLGPEIDEREGADLTQRGLYLDLPPHGTQLFHAERIS